jgi:hypothetical protein
VSDGEAPFVFAGTIVATGAATMSAVEPDERTAVVRVDRVLRAPQQMERIAGREITVRLRSRAEAGATYVFEAEGWLYGDSMAVVETARRKAPAESAAGAAAEHELESAAATDRAERHRAALKGRADDAAAVVLGRVVSVRAAPEAAAAGEERLSEHDPQWAIATVEVDETMKGRASGTVDVMFATSQDVLWRDAPKLAVGQKAVLLLQRGVAEAVDPRANAVVHKLDVQPVDAAGAVAQVL